jgi:hypothetical protein
LIRIYGVSDDLVEVETSWGRNEEYDSYGETTSIIINGELTVKAVYGKLGPTWSFNILAHNENITELPEIRIVPEHDYSFAVELDYPDGTKWTVEGEEE